ncbi:MAG: cadherin repeat domain-containing protein [Bacteroidetes bacterium]|nr:cadherin repeat domain-containing protein [Bacteroidota bacterium]
MERQIRTNRKMTFVAGIAVMMVLPFREVPAYRNPVILNKSVQIEETIITGSIVYDVNDENSKTDRDADGNQLVYLIVGQDSQCPYEIEENTGVIRIKDTTIVSSGSKKIYKIIVYADNGIASDDAQITINIRKRYPSQFISDSGGKTLFPGYH